MLGSPEILLPGLRPQKQPVFGIFTCGNSLRMRQGMSCLRVGSIGEGGPVYAG